MGQLKIEIPKSIEEAKKQIKALENVIKTDTREEDIKNHKMALETLSKYLNIHYKKEVIALAETFKENDIKKNCVLSEDERKDIEFYFKYSSLYNEVKSTYEGNLKIDIFTFERLFIDTYLSYN